MPSWLQAIILGIVQGLTEFIPVSSSGHLVLVPYLAGWEPPSLAFDVALHIGTTVGVLLFFRRELIAMARGVVLGGRDPDGRIYRRLAVLVVVATVPVAIVGLLLEDAIADAFGKPLLVAGFLLITAALLTLAERTRALRVRRAARTTTTSPDQATWKGDWRGEPAGDAPAEVGVLPTGDDPEDPTASTLPDLTLRQAVTVGLAQCVAVLPGVSRSGSTISAGMMAGMTREAATRFSFLLSLPTLFGAFILSLPDIGEPGGFSGVDMALGVVASFISGYAAVGFLVRLVARDKLTGFARYCVFLAVVTFIAYQFLGPPSTA